MEFENILLEEMVNKINSTVIKYPHLYISDYDIENFHDKNIISNNEYTRGYTESSYHINKTLWNQNNGIKMARHVDLVEAHNINSMLDRNNSAPDDFSVYSGLKRDRKN